LSSRDSEQWQGKKIAVVPEKTRRLTVMTQKRKVSELRTNPLSTAIYGEHEDISDLVESIMQHGLLAPLVVKPDGTILSGHRRFAAISRLGWQEVECSVYEPKDTAEEEIYVIEANRTRQKTARQLRLEGARLKKLLSESALQKRMANLNNNAAEAGDKPAGDGSFTGRTQAEVAKQLGISQALWNRINYINNHVEIGNQAAIEAAGLLDAGKISINKAYRMVRKAIQALDTPEGDEKDDVEDTPAQTAQEFNLACMQSVKSHMKEICNIIKKVKELTDEDFNAVPWRCLQSTTRFMNSELADIDKRASMKLCRVFAQKIEPVSQEKR